MNVVNTPNVNVANTVQVSEPFREAVNVKDQFEVAPGNSVFRLLYTVPPGKQLVVTYVSAAASGAPSGQPPLLQVWARSDGESFAHYFKLVAVNDSILVAGEPVQFRVDAATELVVSIEGPVSITLTVSGYLVDVP